MDSNAKNNGPKSTADADQPKRRACDECRARKLACSKEADGCSRCKREGIRCNYSLQKQMGRPRKRPRGETEPETEVDNDHQNSSDQRVQLHVPAPFVPPPELGLNSFDFDFTFDPDLAMDLDLSFLDMDNSNNLDFFDLMQTQAPTSLNVPVDEHLSQPNYLWNPDLKGAASVPEGPMDLLAASWPTGSLGSVNIDFNPGPQPAPPPQAPEFSPEGVAALITSSLSPERQEKTPGLSPDSSGSYASDPEPQDPESGPTLVATDTSSRPTECQCFSKLYLALDSLQHLPNDFESAMAVTRNASKTAYQTVTCPVCGDPPLDMHFRTEEHSTDYWLRPFQNIMMLGALLPSLSNAYVRILKMVDSEAAKAEAENRKMIFKLEQYGGVWGRAAEEHVTCSVSLHVEGLQLEPAMWRMTARALLKFDVYGYSKVDELAIPGVEDDRPFVQVGLKDIMNMMEERSKQRHELLDNLVAEGKLTIPSNTCYNHPSKRHIEGKPQCMVIIDIAKKSMADLVIP
ncbi:hypothetical protein QBC37DRAFT_275446 [Rhypophila decipiens]|uniref:Zn(2)-C6 fungal-type domain-containing protein n=1 Tax=Rhypophila decipiens TaxID=261697 RepID=A0AAN6YIA1_9PEZI|nr:hypothetical protein QBC37DRAFT_275446 [Rhypophila decipiens]